MSTPERATAPTRAAAPAALREVSLPYLRCRDRFRKSAKDPEWPALFQSVARSANHVGRQGSPELSTHRFEQWSQTGSSQSRKESGCSRPKHNSSSDVSCVTVGRPFHELTFPASAERLPMA